MTTALGTRLGTELGTQLGAELTAPLSQQFAALFLGAGAARDFWFDASSYSLDGGSGNVQSWVDYYDATHTLTVPGAVRVAPPAASGNFGGALVATFTGAESYVSSRALANWKFAHDGTGSTIYLAWRPTSDAVAIMVGTSSNPEISGGIGFDMYRTGVAGQAQTRAVGINSTFTTNWTVNVATYCSITMGSGAWEIKRKAASLASGTGATFGTAAAQYPLTLGRLGVGLVGEWRALGGFHRVLSAYEQSVVRAQLLATAAL